MSDMLGRATHAMAPFYVGAMEGFAPNGDCWRGVADDIARAVLFAALDPADEALVNIVASYIKDHPPWQSINTHQARDCARKAIALLQQRVEDRAQGVRST